MKEMYRIAAHGHRLPAGKPLRKRLIADHAGDFFHDVGGLRDIGAPGRHRHLERHPFLDKRGRKTETA